MQQTNEFNPLRSILDWFRIANVHQSLNKNVQYGCHLEEVSEMAQVLTPAIENTLKEQADAYKQGRQTLPELTAAQRQDVLDSLCDQIVTAVGTAYLLNMDIYGAMQEVCRSNHSKFEDGKAVFDEHGKIRKGKNYVKPDLSSFIK